ncbi:MAG: diadenylate cyclase CdaA [bacterium]|nr:diadenylate cyclase CdaA [bacterium]
MNTVLVDFGLFPLRIVDVVDILLVSTLFYYIWKLSQRTRASRMWIGIIVLLALGMIARLINLRALSWFLASLSAFWAIAFVILFQPELRRALSDLGKTPFYKKRLPAGLAEILVRACNELSIRRWGAIILIRQKNTIDHLLESGIMLHADIQVELFVNIFAPNTPLHDGAVIVDGDRILAARCVLPVSEEIEQPIGMRHRAALTITQETDAIAIVVSEESGKVSLAKDGEWILFQADAIEHLPYLQRVLGLTTKS